MTGFGRAEMEEEGRKLTVELKTVNHRFLDINIRIPRTLGFTEELVRKTIKERLSRGRVDVFVNYSALAGDAKAVTADIGLMRAYLNTARNAAAEAGVLDDLQLSDMIRIPDIIMIQEESEDEDRLSRLVQTASIQAIEALEGMRLSEGESLKINIIECLNALESVRQDIDNKKSEVVAEYAAKLKQRITELIAGTDIDEARFNTEVALMADRADVTEEIVRLNTHIREFKKAVGDSDAVGRKLDFMVQEMNREMNTIGSKSQDYGITSAVIEGKSIIEKIREQVQNIE
jgi:uncharacterized protein (TIGR00255 family)